MKMRDSIATNDAAAELSRHMSEWLQSTNPADIWQNCSTCNHMAKDDRTCTKFNVQPPVSTVVKGCDFYSDAFEVPF